MKLAKLELALLTSLFIFVGTAQAQQPADYNDGIKQELKKEDMTVKATTLPAKKVVQKRIRKSTKKVVQNKKLVKKHKLIAKADTDTNVKSDAVPVVVKDSSPVAAKENDAPLISEYSSDSSNAPVLEEPKTIASNSNQVTPIYVLTPAQTSTAPAVAANDSNAAVAAQVQPATTVDSTVVPEPKSELLRKQREDLEHQNDSAVVEKLEADRIAAEKARADKIMAVNDAAPVASPVPTPVATPVVVAPVVAPVVATSSPTPVMTPVASVTPAPAPLAPVAVVQPEASPVSSPVAIERLTPSPAASPVANAGDAAVTATVAPKAEGENTAVVDTKAEKHDDDTHNFTVGATGGLANYPGVGNIIPYYSAGVMGTYKFDDHFALQVNFDYSDFNITNATYCPFCSGGSLVKQMNQYNFATGVTYDIFKTRITPLVGALLDYTRRNYQNSITYGYNYGTPSGSNAFDGGLVAGVDFNITKSLILGAQFQYFWNLTYNTDNPLAYSYYGPIYGSPVESLSYYIVGLNLRFAL